MGPVLIQDANATNSGGFGGRSGSYQSVYQRSVDNSEAFILSDFEVILQSIAGFLIIAGGILAGIAILVSGIMYMSAGSDSTRLTTAKAWFKNGIIGALILFAVGLIINTILLVATDPFGFFS